MVSGTKRARTPGTVRYPAANAARSITAACAAAYTRPCCTGGVTR
jgi:hypothetical protein